MTSKIRPCQRHWIDKNGYAAYDRNRKGGGPMDIGTKMKNARIHAGYTQEEIAQALGVSRQTISNWETGVSHN